MVTKVERYRTRQGKEMISEESAVIHEAVEDIIFLIPELEIVRNRLSANMQAISAATLPVASYYGKTTPEAQPETTREPCRMGVDIPVMAPGDKIIMLKPGESLEVTEDSIKIDGKPIQPSDRPKWSVCHDEDTVAAAAPMMKGYVNPEHEDLDWAPGGTMSDRLSAAVGSMHDHKDVAKEWLQANGFAHLREFCQRSSGHWLSAWENHLWDHNHPKPIPVPNSTIKRLWLDGKPINPWTGDPCPYKHPDMTTCPHCTGWFYRTDDAGINEKLDEVLDMGYIATDVGEPRPPVAGEPFDPEDAICDCSALMNGDAVHSPTCITQTARRVPKGDNWIGFP